MRPILAQRAPLQRGLQIGAEYRRLTHGETPAAAHAVEASAVADSEDLRVGLALQGRANGDESGCIAGQLARRQPRPGTRTAGQQQAPSAPYRFVTTEQPVILDTADRAMLAHLHTALTQMPQCAQPQPRPQPIEQGSAAEQRQRRYLVGQCQGQFHTPGATTENSHAPWLGLPLLPAFEHPFDGPGGQHLHTVTLLGWNGHAGTDVERQPLALQAVAVSKLEDARIGVERRDLALNQLDLGRPAQRLQLHAAVCRAETAADQPRQHACIPGLRPGAEQADTAWRTLHQRPAAQHTKMGMAGTGQNQVVLGHALLHPSRYWLGVWPVQRLKARPKLLLSLKPSR